MCAVTARRGSAPLTGGATTTGDGEGRAGEAGERAEGEGVAQQGRAHAQKQRRERRGPIHECRELSPESWVLSPGA